MKEITIPSIDAGQRLDKFLLKYLNNANKSFIYKMLRKKNIKLNGKKALGSELLCEGDALALFLSDETIDKFMQVKKVEETVYPLDIVYEDDNIILVNKPQGILSQPGENSTDCINSRILSYLYKKGQYDISKDSTFTPGISNRLDRNTSGIIICGKNYQAVKELNDAIKKDKIEKFYVAMVHGEVKENMVLKGYHIKGLDNQAKISHNEEEGSKPVITEVTPLKYKKGITYVKIKLVTGKTHQIRAHLLEAGFPVVGDKKYTRGEKSGFSTKYQLLHGEEIIFSTGFELLHYLENKKFTAKKPKEFIKAYRSIFES